MAEQLESLSQEPTAPQINLPFSAKEWRFFAAVVLANLALDVALMAAEQWLLAMPSRGYPYTGNLEAFAITALIAQIAILAVWASLFEGSNLLRVMLATLAVCVSYNLLREITLLMAPAVIEYRDRAPIRGLPMIVVILFAAQLPFWLLRFFRGWRIRHKDAAEMRAGVTRRFTMLDLLGWAAFLSLPLGMAQAYREYGYRFSEMMIVVACLVFLLWISGSMIVWATLNMRQSATGVVVRCFISLVMLILIGAPLIAILFPQSPRESFFVFQFVQLGAAVVGIGTGIAARAFGYRLHRTAGRHLIA
jgi:hypothetical protein